MFGEDNCFARFLAQFLYEHHHVPGFAGRHPGSGLVQEHQISFGGQGDPDFQTHLLTVRQLFAYGPGLVGQFDHFQILDGLVVQVFFVPGKRIQIKPAFVGNNQGHQDVFMDGHGGEYGHPLEGPANTQFRDAMGGEAGYIFALENFDKMNRNIYNVGSDKLCLTKEQVALKIKKYLNFYLKFAEFGNDPDKRNYIVSFNKINKLGFNTKYNLDYGIKEMIKAFSFMDQRDSYYNDRVIQ